MIKSLSGISVRTLYADACVPRTSDFEAKINQGVGGYLKSAINWIGRSRNSGGGEANGFDAWMARNAVPSKISFPEDFSSLML